MTERNFIKYHRNNKIHEIGKPESYVTSSYLYDIICSGERIRVTSDDTGEDITNLVMARLIYDKIRTKKVAYDSSALAKLMIGAYRGAVEKKSA